MTVSSSWEVTINPALGVRFFQEPFRCLRADIFELFQDFLEIVRGLGSGHLPKKGRELRILISCFEIFLKVFKTVSVCSEGEYMGNPIEKSFGSI